MAISFSSEVAFCVGGLGVAFLTMGYTFQQELGSFRQVLEALFLSAFQDYKILTLHVTIILHTISTYLDLRQHEMYFIQEKPQMLDYVPDVEFTKAQRYGAAKSHFKQIASQYTFFFDLIVLWMDVLPWCWKWTCDKLVEWDWQDDPQNPSKWLTADVRNANAFALALLLFSTVHNLPWGYYNTFVLEQKFGFNKSTVWTFAKDCLTSVFLSVVLGFPILTALLHVLQWGGRYFYVYTWLFTLLMTGVLIVIAPVVIMPLFNTFTPLPQGSLRTAIEKLASRISFPLYKLFVVDGSKRSAHSNAYFFGLFKFKRIVLFDTLLNDCEDEEIVAVVGHELGHWKLNHTTRMMVLQQVTIFVHFFVFGLVMNEPRLYTDFGFRKEDMSMFVGLLLFSNIYAPISTLTGLYMILKTRKHEFEADSFAVALGYREELREALIKLQRSNLGTMIADPWYSAWHFSHPPLPERLRALKREPKTWIKQTLQDSSSS